MNKYFRFLFNSIILFFIVCLADLASGSVLKHFYFKQTSGLLYRTTYVIDSTKAEILVFGSSRANHHYVPEVFTDTLNRTFYNSGREGNFLLYNYAVFKAVITRYSPGIVLFDIQPDELFYEKSNYDRLSSLLPYYKNHPEIRKIVNLRSPYEKYKMISSIYPYNSSLLTIAAGNFGFNRSRRNDRSGYIPLHGALDDTVLYNLNTENSIIDTNKVNALKDIIKLCREKEIGLILVHSPVYAIVEKNISTDLIEKISQQNNIVYLDYLNNPEFISNVKFFMDQDHLNDTGARYFSRLIAHTIKEQSEIKIRETGLN